MKNEHSHGTNAKPPSSCTHDMTDQQFKLNSKLFFNFRRTALPPATILNKKTIYWFNVLRPVLRFQVRQHSRCWIAIFPYNKSLNINTTVDHFKFVIFFTSSTINVVLYRGSRIRIDRWICEISYLNVTITTLYNITFSIGICIISIFYRVYCVFILNIQFLILLFISY